MEIIGVIIIAAAVFGICFLVDRLFQKLFRSRAQHLSGLSVRVSKRYGSFGLILVVLGIAAIFAGIRERWILVAGGGVVILLGIGLILYYLTVGIYYDEESFLTSGFLSKSRTYRYGQIRSQQLYTNGGGIIIELSMENGQTVQLHSGMKDIYAFMDKAFAGWLVQTGRKKEDCPFYDPDNSRWFPSAEE